MIRPVLRAAAVALLGAVSGVVALALVFTTHPAVALEMDRGLTRNISGVYPPERAQDVTFAWTSGLAELALTDLNRHVPWTCTVRFRGGRAEPAQQPAVEIAVDGIRGASSTATNEYQDLDVMVPQRERQGVVLSIAASPTAVPGPQDPRPLGVQLDRVACRPDAAGALPPRGALASAALAGAAVGAAFASINITAGSAAGAAVLVSAAQAVPLASGLAPYVDHGAVAIRLAVCVGMAMVLAVRGAEWRLRQRIRNTARFAIAFSAAALYLQLLALLHPSKTIVDAVFQAHRFQSVLEGRLLFTQGMPGGVQFPYAVGLYVFAAPWSLVTNDYVSLLRIVVCASQIVAGALLYVMVARTWGDRLCAAIATALFSLVPMKYLFIGSANLTNVFGESVAVATLAALTVLPLRQWRHVAIVVGLAAWAFLCHVSTFATLFVTLSAAAVLYWRLGGPALRIPAVRTLAIAIVAAMVSVAAYYGHFVPVYKDALRIRAAIAASPKAPAPPPAVQQDPGKPPTKYRVFTPLPVRIFDALTLTVAMIGWPILALAAIGAWRTWLRGVRDRLTLAVLAWIVTYGVFLAVAVMRVDVQYQRFSYEFVGRLAFATYPAAVILAAYGAAWAWSANRIPRIASTVLLASAVVLGVRDWLGWLE